jgi:uncharacterized damage-inducible protein DinB
MRTRAIIALAIAAFATAPLSAQATMAPKPTMAAGPTVGFRAEFLASYARVTNEYLQLAEAIPADKYTWHPAGARSVAEVFLHISNAQYIFGGASGFATPAGWDMKTFESSTTDKAKVIAAMKAAFDWYKAGVLAMSDADADKTATLFGQTFTWRALLLNEAEHNGEHLGQMIAYARMNGIVPPWSMKQGGM